MDFGTSEEDRLIRENAKEFVQKYVTPKRDKISYTNNIPEDIIQKAADAGFIGFTVSEKYGGAGGSISQMAAIVEELARGDVSMALPVYVLLLNGWPAMLEKYGSEEIKEEMLPSIVKGRTFMGIGSTEPSGGSDVMNEKSNAVRKGNSWSVSGEKVYISGVREALNLSGGGGFLTLLRTGDKNAGSKAFTTFALMIKGTDGKLKSEISTTIFNNIAREGLSTGGFSFNNLDLDDKYRVGEIGQGFRIIMEGFNIARIYVAAACNGAALEALDMGREHLKSKMLFDQPLGKQEGLQFELSELYGKLESSRLLTQKASWILDRVYKNKEKVPLSEQNLAVSLAKMTGPPTAHEIITKVMVWHGAMAYTKDLPLGAAQGGVMSYYVGAEGGINIMKLIIARELLGKEFLSYKSG
ncbi:MAG: acyl-CoA/acyl-ACP dehydrogenase [Candidatus Thermoplasmatota archaeon]|jgi:acyl-CoA dehydrogenase|nr:acyl-CoA/acyl-ACP dehydrogenase [Candidatus Thermoplasmatota archaeon]